VFIRVGSPWFFTTRSTWSTPKNGWCQYSKWFNGYSTSIVTCSERRWRAPGLVQVWILCQFWWSARYSTPAQQTAYGTCAEHQKHHRSTNNLEWRLCILALFGKQECRQYLWAASNLSLIAGGLKTQVRLPLPTSLLSCSHLYPKATVTRILPSPYLISNTP
jgi:hypothetical protein